MSTKANPFPANGLGMPAEWVAHRACWLAWPSHAELWETDLPAVRREFAALCRAIGGEALEVLVLDDAGRAEAGLALEGLDVRFHQVPFGDIWLRDTAPLFLVGPAGRRATLVFEFNGWGGKYLLEGDRLLGGRLAALAGRDHQRAGMVFEGGAVEVDGGGLGIASRTCLLSPARNPDLDEEAVTALLSAALGLSEVLWLEGMLAGDHTDGHVDTLARFAPGRRVLLARAGSTDDPNSEVLDSVAGQLRGWAAAMAEPLELVEVPSPGSVVDENGLPLPASYLNFYISNSRVVVPVFGTPYDDAAVRVIASCFNDRATVGLPAANILKGGGAFHCITMQEPAPQ
ncbi:MAG: agmatine deiminase family protein [Deltaproteobacteria bacterium]